MVYFFRSQHVKARELRVTGHEGRDGAERLPVDSVYGIIKCVIQVKRKVKV